MAKCVHIQNAPMRTDRTERRLRLENRCAERNYAVNCELRIANCELRIANSVEACKCVSSTCGCLESRLLPRQPVEFKIKSWYRDDLILNIAK